MWTRCRSLILAGSNSHCRGCTEAWTGVIVTFHSPNCGGGDRAPSTTANSDWWLWSNTATAGVIKVNVRPSQFNQWQARWNAAASLEKIAISQQNQQPLIRIEKADGQYIYNHWNSPASEVSVPLKAVFSPHQIVQITDLCCPTLSSGPNASSDTVHWSLNKTYCSPLNGK